MGDLFHQLILTSASAAPANSALRYGADTLNYEQLADAVDRVATGLLALNLARSERVATFLEKRPETVQAFFGTSLAGGVFVPVNPLLKAEQVAYILRDCNVRILITSSDRMHLLANALKECPDLHTVILVDFRITEFDANKLRIVDWRLLTSHHVRLKPHRVVDIDVAAILYTSGSTGKPKGVVLSHRNLVAGARSVAQYLQSEPTDRVLSVLPLSFDYGLNQLNTTFLVGGMAVLMNYLLPRDVITMVAREQITGLAAVPPLWVQLAQLTWPESATEHMRYITNSGGHMPKATLDALRRWLPNTKPYLMYGLTEAFRSTYLPPEEVDRRPDSIGKAIPNAEIMVVRADGTECNPNEPGELVHRGVHVSLGYWNDPEKTAERFKPAPAQAKGLTLTEMAVWSGDTVRRDEDGFLYFIGRRDEMIKTSGYRVSPTEVEEVIYATGLVSEVATFGVPHPGLGQAVITVAVPKSSSELTEEILLASCRRELPAFMVPSRVFLENEALPRNPNGKIDRKALATKHSGLFDEMPI
jgi:acyl-CoA ligase (AMP-forming) (exosortase A-associated)